MLASALLLETVTGYAPLAMALVVVNYACASGDWAQYNIDLGLRTLSCTMRIYSFSARSNDGKV